MPAAITSPPSSIVPPHIDLIFRPFNTPSPHPMSSLSNHSLSKIKRALACGWKNSMWVGPCNYLREYRRNKRKSVRK